MRRLVASLLFVPPVAAHADFLFPVIPVGGLLHAEFTLTSGGGPLSGIPITMSVRGGCGTVSPTEITTDGAGVGRFDFVAGTHPGVCVLAGQSGSTVVLGRTTIYTPSSVRLTAFPELAEVPAGGRQDFSLSLSADGGTPLYGVPISLGTLPATGASGSVTTGPLVSSDTGSARFTIAANGIEGTFDVNAQAAGASRRMRVWQRPAATGLPAKGRVVAVQGRTPALSPVQLSIVSGPSACQVSAEHVPEVASKQPPPGTLGFPEGHVHYILENCPGPVQLRLDYTDLLPFVAGLWQGSPTSTAPWSSVPLTTTARSITFSTNVSESVVGFAQLGAAAAGPVPRVQDMWWSGPEENGWGMSIAQSGAGALFCAIYAYDSTGKPTWWVVPAGGWDVPTRQRFTGAAYAPYGTPWHAFESRYNVAREPMGPFKLAFDGPDRATLEFTAGSVTTRKAIRRQPFGTPQPSPVSGVGGMWWGGSPQSGWGIAIMQQEATLFSVWFTYDDANLPTWFVMPGGGWSSGDTYVGRIYRTRGSPWLGGTYDPAILQVTDVGSFSMQFSGGAATFSYALEGRTGTMPITRQLPF